MKITKIIRFELSYKLKSLSIYISFLIHLLIPVIYVFDDNIKKVYGIINSPYNLITFFYYAFLITSIIILIFSNILFHCENKNKYRNVLFSYPIDKKDYFIAKYVTGITVILIFIFLFILSYGISINSVIYIKPNILNKIVNIKPVIYVLILLVFIIPNYLILYNFLFAINIFGNFNKSVLLFTTSILLHLITSVFLINEQIYLVRILDPFGKTFFDYSFGNTIIKSINSFNTMLIVSNDLIISRLVWIFISFLALLVSYKKFTYFNFSLDV